MISLHIGNKRRLFAEKKADLRRVDVNWRHLAHVLLAVACGWGAAVMLVALIRLVS